MVMEKINGDDDDSNNDMIINEKPNMIWSKIGFSVQACALLCVESEQEDDNMCKQTMAVTWRACAKSCAQNDVPELLVTASFCGQLVLLKLPLRKKHPRRVWEEMRSCLEVLSIEQLAF